MDNSFEDLWLAASASERHTTLASVVVQSRIAERHALAEFNELLDYYTSQNWVSDDVPVEAMNASLNAARDALEVLQRASEHASYRLDDALSRCYFTYQARLQREVLIRDAVARSGTDHISEYTAVARLMEEHAPNLFQRRASSRSR